VKPTHGRPPDIPTQDNRTRERMEQRKALLQILEMDQRDIDTGNSRDVAEFLDELDGESPDQRVLA
jgi:hypothetical protein